jgi:hypothetical protein
MDTSNSIGYSPILFGSRLRDYFEKRNLNANQVGNMLGMDRGLVRQVFIGRGSIRVSTLHRFIEVFPDLDIYYCLTGKRQYISSKSANFEQNANIEKLLSEKMELLEENRKLRLELDKFKA